MHLFAFVSPIIFVAIVTILGFVTPGYNHINHTISRLAIEQYGWVQTLNFFQLAVGYVLIGTHIAKSMRNEESRRIIKIFFAFSASILVFAALAPTDPIDNIPFRFTLLTPTGSVHVATVLIFLFLSPLCIAKIVQALRNEPKYRKYATLTAIIGTLTFVASVIWLAFFVLGVLLPYRGIFQKTIILVVLFWITTLHIRSFRLFSTERV